MATTRSHLRRLFFGVLVAALRGQSAAVQLSTASRWRPSSVDLRNAASLEASALSVLGANETLDRPRVASVATSALPAAPSQAVDRRLRPVAVSANRTPETPATSALRAAQISEAPEKMWHVDASSYGTPVMPEAASPTVFAASPSSQEALAAGALPHLETPVLPTGPQTLAGKAAMVYCKALAAFSFFAVAMLLCLMAVDRPRKRSGAEATPMKVTAWLQHFPTPRREDIERALRPRGYDLLTRPLAAGTIVRIEGRITAAPNKVLRSPLARRPCVLFSASANESRRSGNSMLPLLLHAISADFEVELGAPYKPEPVKVHVRGRDVMLFQMAGGMFRKQVAFRSCEEHLHGFLRAHGPSEFSPDSCSVLDFAENCLELGASVTCVGELRRMETGELRLLPLEGVDPWTSTVPNASPLRRTVSGRFPGFTSWERTDQHDQQEMQTGKVLISDDPSLLGSCRGQRWLLWSLCGFSGSLQSILS
mmetsp:Transcript_49176/g.106963  ORF Transcript_49176/g.106963 Transcript_49176/m.106963 type:complete len:482 (+) Transcript_49176:190-1635(+)